jgi:hypothetical protein
MAAEDSSNDAILYSLDLAFAQLRNTPHFSDSS